MGTTGPSSPLPALTVRTTPGPASCSSGKDTSVPGPGGCPPPGEALEAECYHAGGGQGTHSGLGWRCREGPRVPSRIEGPKARHSPPTHPPTPEAPAATSCPALPTPSSSSQRAAPPRPSHSSLAASPGKAPNQAGRRLSRSLPEAGALPPAAEGKRLYSPGQLDREGWWQHALGLCFLVLRAGQTTLPGHPD